MNATMYLTGEYLAANPDWHAGDAPYKARWIESILERNALAPAHVVDVGSGSGEVLVELARTYPQAHFEGYDISPQSHAIARRKRRNNLIFHLGDYFASRAERPDLLMAIDVIEHVDDYLTFVCAAKPRATWKLFHIPLDLSVQGLLRGPSLMTARREVGHLHYFCKETALATLRECGHEIVDWNYTHPAETMGEALRTRLFNVPRRLARTIHADFGVRLMGGASMMVLTR